MHFGINYPRAQEWCISQLPRGISPFIDVVPGPPPGLAGLFRCDWLLSRPERRGPPVTSRPSPTLHRVFRSDEIQRMRAGGPQGNRANLTASPADLRRKWRLTRSRAGGPLRRSSWAHGQRSAAACFVDGRKPPASAQYSCPSSQEGRGRDARATASFWDTRKFISDG